MKFDGANIIIECNGTFYKFLRCSVEKNDGSFYITFIRDGKNSETITFDSDGKEPRKIIHDSPREKMVRMSYHSSGRVNYHYTEIASTYYEPIPRLRTPNSFVAWSIPSINKLDEASEIRENDFVLQLAPCDERIQFALILAPWDYMHPDNHVAIRYEGLASLIVVPFSGDMGFPEGLDDHFVTLAPSQGAFPSQQLPNDQALTEFHQLINNHQGLIIYPPNSEGVYKIITAVPMRDAPKVTISLVDDSNSVELVSAKNNVVRFKVKDRHGHTIKNPVQIKGIELDSRL